MYPPFGVPMIIRDSEGKILVGKRTNTSRFLNHYQLPAGVVEPGEPLAEAVIRELKEETDLDAREVRFIGVAREWQTDHEHMHIGFEVVEYSGEPKNMEPEKHDEWYWCAVDELPEPFVPGHRFVIDLFLKGDSNENLIDVPNAERKDEMWD